MSHLYEVLETNMINDKKLLRGKIDVLFDLDGNTYQVSDIEHIKSLLCISGKCDLTISNENISETITLDKPNISIKVNKNLSIEISNYTKQTKIGIEYFNFEEESSNG